MAKSNSYNLLARPTAGTRRLDIISPEGADAWLDDCPLPVKAWAKDTGFKGVAGSAAVWPDPSGRVGGAVAIVDPAEPMWSMAGLPRALAPGDYQAGGDLDADQATRLATGWALGGYVFDRYRPVSQKFARLVWPRRSDRKAALRAAAATYLVRDLVNTPAGDMGPPELAAAARRLARTYKARCEVIVGDTLLKKGYPAIHAIGRAADKAPRLIDIRWGRAGAPRVTLVGKGVCFDTGGLDLKSAGNMKLMKKDMGGAAHVLGLAQMIMDTGLDVRLRVLIPAVENSISGNAVYPLDVVAGRSGRTIEIGHTDAEGRVVLSDALTEASRENPDLLIDFATLTGAARVALGTEIAAMFANRDDTAGLLLSTSSEVEDPVWRLPLWPPYKDNNKSTVADISNEPSSSFGGAISAALFLESFVESAIDWVHFDVMAWNTRARPGRPKGGEAMGMRATFELIRRRYGGERKAKDNE